uniref:Uncharacterized protein n=1 Tax=Panagrolaimus superbus TaxID=310955 RepID=A0A914Y068_9BILA
MDSAMCEIRQRSSEAVQTSKNLMSAPEACSMMEALTVFSSCIKKDPSLKSGDPLEKFEYLRRPDSLKGSLYQVANAMSQTFQTAHDSVTTIVDSLENMPTLMTDCLEAMEIIDQPGSQDVIDYALETLTYSAEQCVNAALEVDTDCSKALLIINELCEAATATDGRNKQEVEKTKGFIEQQNMLKMQQESLIKQLKADLAEQKGVVEEAMSDYKERMADANNFSSIVGAMLLDNLSGIVHTLTSSASNLVQAVASMPAGACSTLKDIMISSFKKDELLTLAMVCNICLQ